MSRIQKASKRLSYVLRHRPDSAGVELDPNGWASLPHLLSRLAMSMEDFTLAVEQNDKNRFEWDEVGDRVRARQGHSIAVDLGLEPVTPPAVLFHGTVLSSLPAIMESGLLPMTRDYVHLSSNTSVALDVAGRRGRGEACLLRIRGEDLEAENIEVFCSTNGVFLTRFVPPHLLHLTSF